MVGHQEVIWEDAEMTRAIARMAREIVEKSAALNDVVLIGIRSRGAHLARRLARRICEAGGIAPPVGVIDVTPFRDDRADAQVAGGVNEIDLPLSVDDKTVVLIDDVIFRGRTIRAAMDAVEGLGRPKRMLVAVLIDRGARELPIRADIVGKNISAAEGRRVNVLLVESDGIDRVTVADWPRRR